MDQEKNEFYYKLDFLYQSIAVYAVTIVLYLAVRSFFAYKQFPTLAQDPVLYLLSAITLISVFALVYNLLLQRRIVVEDDRIRFISSIRERVLTKSEIAYMRFGRERRLHAPKMRIIKIGLKARRRPVRIRPLNFQNSSKLTHILKEWAGPLAQASRRGLKGRRNRNLGSVGEH
jgi:hypothetical protein